MRSTQQATPNPRVAVVPGDGVGPEITGAVLHVLDAAGANLDVVELPLGLTAAGPGSPSGVPDAAWEILHGADAVLKGPVETPQGGGMKSVNVTLRKAMGLYANVRPCRTYQPLLAPPVERMDVLVVRENEEDVYAGIEHRQTEDVVQCLKLISRTGCERIARYAFQIAEAQGRKRVTCFTKDNIMKLTDGLFRQVFEEVARDHPGIEAEHRIVDIGMARAARRPGSFDVILAPNLYGDILSDVLAEAAGSIGLAPSANVGPNGAVFEAVHGSAPDIAGQDVANPSALLLSAAMMLSYLGKQDLSETVRLAWKCTLEDGVATPDLAHVLPGARIVGTEEFGREVAARLGQTPRTFAPGAPFLLPRPDAIPASVDEPRGIAIETVGVDVFVNRLGDTEELARILAPLGGEAFELKMLTCRGAKVWPAGQETTRRVDHVRARFLARGPVGGRETMALMSRVVESGLDVIKHESLRTFDGKNGFTAAQGA